MLVLIFQLEYRRVLRVSRWLENISTKITSAGSAFDKSSCGLAILPVRTTVTSENYILKMMKNDDSLFRSFFIEIQNESEYISFQRNRK